MAPKPSRSKTTSASPDRPLTAGQERFAQEYVRTNNCRLSYSIAYPRAKPLTCEANGSRMLALAKVAVRVADLRAVVAKTNQVDAEWVVARLKTISDRCMAAEPVRDDDGKATGVFLFDATGANRSTELLGKAIGMFSERLRVDVRDVTAMTDQELEDEARRLGVKR